MAVIRDWIPKQINKFKIFADNICKLASSNAMDWHLDADEISKLLALRLIFNRYYRKSTIQNTHSLNDTDNTQKARKPYEKAIRGMGIGRMKNNSFMTDGDKRACGLNIGEKGYTLSPVAKVSPLIDYRNMGKLGGKVISMNPATHKTCKPVGQDGIKVTIGFYRINEPIPLEVDCTFVALLTKSFGKVIFPDTKEGYCFVGYARYYNTRAIEGNVATTFYGVVN